MPGWLALLTVIASLMGGLGLIRLAGRVFALPPEVRRKSLHIAMGVVAMTFPWLFDDAVWVVATCAVGAATLTALRHPILKSGIGSVVHDVERGGRGELWFALAVACLFAIAGDRPALYVAALAVLTFADAAAALVGTAWGRSRAALPGKKSWEGCAAFALTAVLVCALTLAAAGLSATQAVSVAAVVAIPCTALEAVAERGSDNLTVPVGAYLLLDSATHIGLDELLVHAIGLFALAGLMPAASRLAVRSCGALTTVLRRYWAGGWSVGPCHRIALAAAAGI